MFHYWPADVRRGSYIINVKTLATTELRANEVSVKNRRKLCHLRLLMKTKSSLEIVINSYTREQQSSRRNNPRFKCWNQDKGLIDSVRYDIKIDAAKNTLHSDDILHTPLHLHAAQWQSYKDVKTTQTTDAFYALTSFTNNTSRSLRPTSIRLLAPRVSTRLGKLVVISNSSGDCGWLNTKSYRSCGNNGEWDKFDCVIRRLNGR